MLLNPTRLQQDTCILIGCCRFRLNDTFFILCLYSLTDIQSKQTAAVIAFDGRGFARSLQALAPSVRIEWFHQGANKEARILSNSATALHLVRFPRGWNLRWPELYAHLTTYRRKFRANRWHDAADVVTGIVEREAAGRGQKRVRGIRFL